MAMQTNNKRKPIIISIIIAIAAFFLGGFVFSDRTPPVITTGAYTVEYNNTIDVAKLATCVDNRTKSPSISIIDCEPHNSVVFHNSDITFQQPGKYSVLLESKDEKNNTATAMADITVIDSTGPVMNGIPKTFELKETDTEINYLEGISACDEVDGDCSISLTADDSIVQYGKAGAYYVIYTATDNTGNTVTQKVPVTILDETPPEITVPEAGLTAKLGGNKNNYISSIMAKDNLDHGSGIKKEINDSAVNYNSCGVYPVFITLTDSSGNTTTRESTVSVIDKTDPTLSILQSDVSVNAGTGVDYSSIISAEDNDGISQIIVDDSQVDYNTAGRYSVTVTAVDNSGNTSSKNINVKINPTPPPVRASVSTGGRTVYVTKTGQKYHESGCRYLRESKLPISLEDAKRQGYTPCSVCH